jgi:TolA-binding protein
MNDPRRMLMGEASAVERALLQAADADEPPSGGEQRLLLSLGLLGPDSPAGPSTAPAAQAALGKSLVALSGKWLVLAGIGASVWWVAELRRPAPVETTRALQRAEPAMVAPIPERSESAPDSALAQEVAALDRAQKALVSGDQRGALGLLADYQRDYPSGILQQEASLLHIEALLGARDEQHARSAAAAFLRAHPESPHAARVQALLKGGSPARGR